MQLRRDVLPALNDADVKLFAVGIGSGESARTFAEKIEFPAELLFADESDNADAHSAVGTRNTKRDATTGKQIFEGVESMWSAETNDAIKARGRDDLNSITGNPLQPRALRATDAEGQGALRPEGHGAHHGPGRHVRL